MHLSQAELNAPQDVITCKKKSISTLASRASDHTASTAAIDDCIPMSDAAFATISSIFTIGGLIGALAAGPVTSSRGRWLSIQMTAALYVVGAAIETLSQSPAIMAVGRFVSGVGAGASTVIVPLYISEVAPPAERGFFGAFTQISCNTGILTAQALGYFLSHGSAWRWILGICGLIAAAQGVLTFFIPESPAWTATAKRDVATARRVLQRIRGSGVKIDEEVEAWGAGDDLSINDTAAEEQGLLASDPGARTSIDKAGTSHLSVFGVVRDPLYRPAIIAVVGIMFAQQLCGINSIVMYSVSLLSGLLPLSSVVLTILVSAVNLFMTAACSPLPDKLGRKTCLLISIIGQGSSSLALALSIVFGLKILSALSVLFFVAFFAVGLGPVPFILASELVGQEAVGATQSWSLAANYSATFLVAQFFPIINTAMNDRFGGAGWVYFLFAAFALVFTLFISWRVPETRGKKDADEVWGRTRRID